ncbi:trk system potassium uptake protein TrkH [Pseudobutyrivibrio sp. YE44]|uniref:TrkH family potassium uptake protein n=1 Tax=Pseudobutyrivibrio sp. YE44 TaxID=1520802 RepID=UPI000889B3FC|nr:TrkH family potassium uptake protein [Pseudobutyrivibrio sp. YE44]SDB49829.1 trk system potassium uptake protein TrkH [Pseudobutyrivibrio sp. YE44]
MNNSVIRFILLYVVGFLGLFLMLPIFVAFIYHESVWVDYAIVAFPCLVAGVINSYFKPKKFSFYLKEGFFCTGASWVVLSVIGAIPLWLTGEIPHYIDALFEAVSGFTTTGASIIDNVETLSHASLFWRSFTHLVGGMGVLVFLLTVIPLAGGEGSQFNLMKAESPGPSVGKLVPKLKNTAQMLYLIYLGLCALEITLLLIAGMTPFEAINTGIATAGTGGFGIYANSCAGFNVACQWIIAIFMFVFGVNFNFYYYVLFHHARDAFRMEEVRMYTLLTLGSIGIITFNTLSCSAGLFDALTKAAFQVTSIQSSTGFSTADFAVWPQASRCVLVILMFIGACAGSTGGGIKVSRFVLMGKAVHKELISYIHPRSIRKTLMDGKPVNHDTVRSNNVFFGTFMLVFFVSVFILSFENLDFSTIFTAVIATMSNIGPGMSMVGPAANFAFFTDLSKIVLIFDMLAGRLELFPILMLFHPTIWQDLFTKRRSKELEHAGKIFKNK